MSSDTECPLCKAGVPLATQAKVLDQRGKAVGQVFLRQATVDKILKAFGEQNKIESPIILKEK